MARRKSSLTDPLDQFHEVRPRLGDSYFAIVKSVTV